MAVRITVTDFLFAVRCYNKCGSRLNMNNRHSHGIVITTKGSINFIENGKNTISSPECPVFVPQGSSYINVPLEDSESFLINFHGDCNLNEITPLSFVSPSISRLHFEALERLSLKATSEPLTDSENLQAFAEIYTLLSTLFAKHTKRTETEALFDSALEIIRKNLENPDLSCRYIARSLNISEVYLRRLFNKFASMPTGQYIMRVRMEQARLLISEKIPIKQAAVRVGYSDVYTFTRAYTSYFGFSPGKT